MFEVTMEQLAAVLRDFGITAAPVSMQELQRYHYEKADPDSKEVRLIVKAILSDGRAVVVRFKNEHDVTRELIESQSRFAALLRANGIATPALYSAGEDYARWYSLSGYAVIVTVEEFVEGEVRIVNEEVARKTGALLARTHCIAEAHDCHVDNAVLFDPMAANDLFNHASFTEHAAQLSAIAPELYVGIECEYGKYMTRLDWMRSEPRYAVQGDISDCNLYHTSDGSIGMFDFNRCGDNTLYGDAIMQAVFEARLMDYPDGCAADNEQRILSAFLRGYDSMRPFTAQQREAFPYLYAIISAFWASDVRWSDDSLLSALKKGDSDGVRRRMIEMHGRLTTLADMPL